MCFSTHKKNAVARIKHAIMREAGQNDQKLVYLVTHIVTFRATQFARSKARFAGNAYAFFKNRNAVAGESGGSLRASRQRPPAALHFLDVAPLCLRKRALLLPLGDSLNVTI
jgi:hypothetical protein